VSLEQIMNEFLGLKTIGLIVSSNVHPFIWYNKNKPTWSWPPRGTRLRVYVWWVWMIR